MFCGIKNCNGIYVIWKTKATLKICEICTATCKHGAHKIVRSIIMVWVWATMDNDI